jgi:formyltetrahydrofolate-dependent phosphoribosylglycinamide formyltransferase
VDEKIELICLAGFMQIISKDFLQKWKGRIINIHPSYLPTFKGLNAQEQAIKARVSFSGCTVHFVNEKMYCGEIILQKKVIIKAKDNTESLSKKILREEHIVYPKALEIVASKILKIKH